MNTDIAPAGPEKPHQSSSFHDPGAGKKGGWLLWLVLLLIVAAGTPAAYFYAKSGADKDKAALQKQIDDLKAQVKKAEAQASTKLTIAEFGVTLTLPGSLKGFTYKTDPLLGTPKPGEVHLRADVSAYAEMVKQCNAGKAGPGNLSDGRVYPDEGFVTLSMFPGRYQAPPEGSPGISGYKQLTNSYLLYAFRSDAPCEGTGKLDDTALVKDFVDAFNALTQLKS